MQLFTLGFASDEDLEFFVNYAFEEATEVPTLTVSEFTVQFELGGTFASEIAAHLTALTEGTAAYDNDNAWNLPSYSSVTDV